MRRFYNVGMVLVAGLLLLSVTAQAQPDCVPYCTYTQGGWGAPCNDGNNAGCLRNQCFSEVYPNGVTIGREYPGGCCWIHLTSSQAVEDFLPQGQPAVALTQNYTDPGSGNITVFAGQVLALQLNVDFGSFGCGSLVDISGLQLNTGPFAGWTVQQLLDAANLALGGGALPPGHTIAELNTAVTNVNLEFDNCTNGTGLIGVPFPVVVIRDHGDPLPVHQCLDFVDFQCISVVWWCQFCGPNDLAQFTYVPGCEGLGCNQPGIPNPGSLFIGTQRVDSVDPAGGCWWSAVFSAEDPGAFCVSLDFQLAANLISFTAEAGNGEVMLDWATASEQDNARFDIQRSTNNSTWSTIGQVAGQGTSTVTTHYSFVDGNVVNGTPYQYRLLSVDIAGNVRPVGNTILATPSASAATPREFALHQNYPNPFNPSTQIRFDLPENSYVTLKVFDPVGREVATLVNGNLPASTYSIAFDASGLPTGMYLYRLQAGSYSSVQKMLLIK